MQAGPLRCHATSAACRSVCRAERMGELSAGRTVPDSVPPKHVSGPSAPSDPEVLLARRTSRYGSASRSTPVKQTPKTPTIKQMQSVNCPACSAPAGTPRTLQGRAPGSRGRVSGNHNQRRTSATSFPGQGHCRRRTKATFRRPVLRDLSQAPRQAAHREGEVGQGLSHLLSEAGHGRRHSERQAHRTQAAEAVGYHGR